MPRFHPRNQGGGIAPARWFNRGLARATVGYGGVAGYLSRRALRSLIVLVAIGGAVALLRLPLAGFADGRVEATPAAYRDLPSLEQRGLKNRFVGATVHESSGHQELDAAGMKVLPHWCFRSGVQDGVPIGGDILVPIRFTP